MKKKYLLLSALLLASCSNNASSNSNSENEEPSSSINYVDFEFSSVKELYLDVNETYSLNKMLNASYKNLSVGYRSSDSTIVSVSNGVLEGIDYGDATVSITFGEKKQDVTIHVVDYFEYGSYFTSTDIGRLYKKNVIFFGDSITHNWNKYTHEMELTHGENYDYPEDGWSGFLNDTCEFNEITNAACSGGTMGLPHDNEYPGIGKLLKSKCFPFCVERNIEAVKRADYAFVFYGTNDLSAQIPLYKEGHNLSSDKMNITDSSASFVASMKYGIEKMQEVNPDIKIFFMNIMYRTYAPWSGTPKYKLEDYNKVIKDVAKSYTCRVLDTNCLFDKSNWQANSSDGILHINDAGHKIVADFILNNGVKK